MDVFDEALDVSLSKELLVQISVVVGNVQIRAVKTEVEKGFM